MGTAQGWTENGVNERSDEIMKIMKIDEKVIHLQ